MTNLMRRGGPLEGHDHVARGDYQSAQRQETNQGHRSSIIISKSKNAIGARALYSPLSPPHLPTPGRLFGHGGNIDREVHRGPPPGASGEGGSSLHGPISAMHRTQRAPFDEKHAHNDGHDSRGRNYKLRRSSPRSRGPPSQSETYVWDKALICRRPGESNSSI